MFVYNDKGDVGSSPWLVVFCIAAFMALILLGAAIDNGVSDIQAANDAERVANLLAEADKARGLLSRGAVAASGVRK